MTETSSSVAIGVPGVTSDPGLTLPQAEDAVEGRRDHAIRELRTHDVHARLGRVARFERSVSSWLSEMTFVGASSWPRASWRSVS